MTTLYVTRHGQTQWNLEKRMQGRMDSDLTDLGRMQAAWLGERLHGIDFAAVYMSTLTRAVKTAEIICADRDIPMIKTDLLQEIHLGEWEGQLNDDIRDKHPQQHHNFWEQPHLYKPLGGESYEDIILRIQTVLQDIMDKYPNQNVLVVTHGVITKTVSALIENKELKDFWTGPISKPTSLSIYEYDGETWKVLASGDTSHYKSTMEAPTEGGKDLSTRTI